MPADLGLCVSCSTAAAKYKCPACYAATCSLACSKSHKSNHGETSSSAVKASTSSSTLPARPESTIPLPTAPNADRTKTSSYVPLNSYTENQFLHDYHFLSSIGRKVSSVGSQLQSQGLLPQQLEANLNALQRKPPNSGNGSTGPTYRADFEKLKHLKQRNSLKEEFRKRRCKIMWLPEGMGREVENKSSFNERGKKLRMSLQVEFPLHHDIDQRRKIYHDLPSNLPVQVKVLNELEKESMKSASAEWVAQHKQHSIGPATNRSGGGKRARKRKATAAAQTDADQSDQPSQPPSGEAIVPDFQQQHESSASLPGPGATTTNHDNNAQPTQRQHKPFYISDLVLSKHGLLPSSPSVPSSEPKEYTHLPAHITLAVQIHDMRLRNESSLKYLEWWERRGKHEGENLPDGQEDAIDQLALQANEADATKPMRVWGQLQAEQGGSTAATHLPPADVASGSIAPANIPLISQGILSNLSAKLQSVQASAALARQREEDARQRQRHAGSPTKSSEAAIIGKDLVQYDDDDDDDEAKEIIASARDPSLGEKADVQGRRNLYVLPATTIDSSTVTSFINFETMLRSLPRDWAVVEYPTIEVWRTDQLENKSKNGDIQVIRHPSQLQEQPNADIADTVSQAQPPLASESEKAESPVQVEKPPPAVPAPTAKPSIKVGLGLGGYDSDSDSDSQEPESQPVQQPPPTKRVKTLAQSELLSSAPTSDEEASGH
ncbi:unnamed protein product [Sympodiomycopsis kandeliae]